MNSLFRKNWSKNTPEHDIHRPTYKIEIYSPLKLYFSENKYVIVENYALQNTISELKIRLAVL